jgi:glycosyltransferase involved in cell wall biosynthesis
MRIALIAPPFIAVPPKDYGGTELFIAQLAEGLQKSGVNVVVYANGESTVNVERRWTYEHSQWPIRGQGDALLKDMDHTSWAVQDAARTCNVIHMQTAQGLTCSRFVSVPVIYTIHHPHQAKLSEFYARYPDVHYVAISEFQRNQESLPRIRTILHGIDLSQYRLCEQKQQYLSFIGRIAPIKGTHLAIAVAKHAGIPLKIAGDIQPMHREYFEAKIKPHIDGKFIEYIGLADLEAKNELLGNSMAMLFPIKWDEPFGLVMVEAMACGTPVVSLPGGSVPEIVRDGISGYVCHSIAEMTKRVKNIQISPRALRQYVEENFSLERMVAQYAYLYEEARCQVDSRKIA